jgi:hypothetical protein
MVWLCRHAAFCSKTFQIWKKHFRLINWLYITLLRPVREYFTHMETPPLPVKGCKILAYSRRSGSLNREGSLSCHTCCDTGPRFFPFHPKYRPTKSPLTTDLGMWRIYSNPDPHGSNMFEKQRKRNKQKIQCFVDGYAIYFTHETGLL